MTYVTKHAIERFGDIFKLFTPGGSLLPVSDLDDDAAACLSSIEITTRKVRGGDDDEVEEVSKVRLWDKRAALVDKQWLGVK